MTTRRRAVPVPQRFVWEILPRASFAGQSVAVADYHFGVPEEHRTEADALAERLHRHGWASFVTVDRLLQDWDQLAGEVADYPMTIDDYTNDLTARDGLEQVIEWASESLAAAFSPRIHDADDRFRNATSVDEGAAIGRYFKIAQHPGWWWRRRPVGGELGRHLDGA